MEEDVDAMILALRFLIQDNEAYSLAQMAKLYERLSTTSAHKDKFLEGRAALNGYLDRETDPEIVHNQEKLTNRRILELIIYGERAHENEAKAAVVRSLRSSPVMSAILDNEFNNVAARGLAGVFHLQTENAALYEELTGQNLVIHSPDSA